MRVRFIVDLFLLRSVSIFVELVEIDRIRRFVAHPLKRLFVHRIDPPEEFKRKERDLRRTQALKHGVDKLVRRERKTRILVGEGYHFARLRVHLLSRLLSLKT